MMKTILIITIFFSIMMTNQVFSYDGTIKDKYGRVTGYIDKEDDKTYILDKYGRRGDYIESDGSIKDKYGRRKGTIEKDDQ